MRRILVLAVVISACSFALILAALPASAGDCLRYADYIGWGGALASSGAVNDAAGQDDRVYVTGSLGFQIYSAADPDHPSLLGSLSIPGGAGPLDVAGTFAYLIAGAELLVIDTDDPGAPAIVGRTAIAITAIELAASSSRVCIRDIDGLLLIDVSDPQQPVVGGRVEIFGGSRNCAVYGNYVYTTMTFGSNNNDDRVAVIDATNVQAPIQVRLMRFPSFIYCLVADESILFIGAEELITNGCGGIRHSGVGRFSLANPQNPVAIDSVPLDGNVAMRRLAVGGGWLVVVADEVNVTVSRHLLGFELSAFPSSPSVRVAFSGEVPAVAATCAVVKGYGLNLLKMGDRVYAPNAGAVTTGSGSHVITKDGRTVVAGTALNTAGQSAQLRILQNGASGPALIGSLDLNGIATGLAFAEDNVLLQTADMLGIVDCTVPSLPVLVGQLDILNGTGVWFDPSTHHAVMSVRNRGVVVANIADPANPIVVSTLDLPGLEKGVTGAGDFAYVSTDEKLFVVDVSAPESPVLVGELSLRASPADAIIVDATVIVAEGGGGIEVLDVADPMHPRSISHLTLPGAAYKVAAEGDVVYVATGNDGLVTVNLRNPAAPNFLGSIPVADVTAMAVAADSERVYVAQQRDYHDRCDVSYTSGVLSCLLPECQEVSPVEVTRFEALMEPDAILLRWQIPPHHDVLSFQLYRRSEKAGAFSPLGDPIAAHGTKYECRDADVSPGEEYHYRLKVTYLGGEVAYYGPISATAMAAPFAMRMSAPSPNPFSDPGRLKVRFTLPEREVVGLRVVNTHGRVVREIYRGALERGEHVVYWDGRDANAHLVPAGVFYIELQRFGSSISRRVVKVR